MTILDKKQLLTYREVKNKIKNSPLSDIYPECYKFDGLQQNSC